MHKLLSHWLEFSLDLIFPPTCFYCDVDLVGRESICQSCVDSLARVDAPYCEVCGEPFDGLINSKVVCPNCTDIDLKFDFAIAPLRFSERSVSLVHALKYKRMLSLVPSMAKLMAERFDEDERFHGKQWIICPVPLHRERKIKRTFNQSGELSQHLSKLIDMPYKNLLKRDKATKNQAHLSRAKRLINIGGSISVNSQAEPLDGVNILLIDDVLTTGSTASECTKVLHKNFKIREIAVLTLVRG